MERTRKICYRILLGICAALLIWFLLLVFLLPETERPAVALETIAIAALFFLVGRIALGTGEPSRRRICTVLWTCVALGAALRIACLMLCPVQPIFDFEVYHNLAAGLISGQIPDPAYISVFPHVIGYPFVLSLFYRIFGVNPMVAYGLNAVLQIGIILLTFSIARRFFGDRAALFAAGLLCFLPSYILFIPTVSADGLFAFCMLLLIDGYLRFSIRTDRDRIILPVYLGFYFCFGVFAALAGAIRPFAVLLIPAVLLFELLFYRAANQRFLWRQLGCLLLMVAAYLLTSSAISAGISSVIKRPVAAGGALGYSVKVGLNQEFLGQYNEPDAQQFKQIYLQEGVTAKEAHDQMLSLALSDLRANSAGLPELLRQKTTILWGYDAHAEGYMKSAFYMQGMLTPRLHHLSDDAGQLSNCYYYAVLVWAVWGIVLLLCRRDRNHLLLLLILFLGVFACHLVVEVHARYHFYLLPIFCVFSAWGLATPWRNRHTEGSACQWN